MKVRFQADADFNQNIVRAIRRRDPAIDFQMAHDARLHGVDDERVLARAAEEGRLLVSHDYRTMPRHFATFVTTRTSAAVAEEWINRFDTLPLYRSSGFLMVAEGKRESEMDS